MAKGKPARETVPLEAFLTELPDEAAAEARAAAARIDALERQVGPPGWLERHLFRLAGGALVAFAIGLGLLLGRAAGHAGLPGAGVIVPLLGAPPGLALAYLWSVRGRARLDRAKMDLNEAHFLPHGGLYFGGEGGEDGGDRVLRVAPPKPERPNLRERTERLHAEATRRRWWW